MSDDLLQRMNASVDRAQEAADATFSVLTGNVDEPVQVDGGPVDTVATRIRDYIDSLGMEGLNGEDGVDIAELFVDDGFLWVRLSNQQTPTNLGLIIPEDGVGVESLAVDEETGELTVLMTDATVYGPFPISGEDGVGVTDAYIQDGDLIIELSDGSIQNAGDISQFGGLSANGADITEAGDLIIIFSDGSTQNVGRVVGEQGSAGTSIISGFIDEQGRLNFLRSNGSSFNVGSVEPTLVDGADISVEGARISDGNDGFTEGHLILELTGGDYDVGLVRGTDGDNGLSAYEQAVAGGFQGTESEWLETLDGEDGRGIVEVFIEDEELRVRYTDDQVEVVGPVVNNYIEDVDVLVTEASIQNGELVLLVSVSGDTPEEFNVGRVIGKDAYEIAVDEDGFEGTREEWLESLNGEDGTIFASVEVDENSELIFYDSEANPYPAGTIEQGTVESVEVDSETGILTITLSDQTEISTTVDIRGVDGEDGDGVTGAYMDAEGVLWIEFTEGPDVQIGTVTAPIETDAELIDGDLTITMSDGQVFELGQVYGGDGVYIIAAEIIDGEVVFTTSDNQEYRGVIEKDPTAIEIVEGGFLQITFNDQSVYTTTERVAAFDGDGITNVENPEGTFDLVIDYTTENRTGTPGQVVIEDVYGRSVTDVTVDGQTLIISTDSEPEPLEIEIPSGVDGDTITDVSFDDQTNTLRIDYTENDRQDSNFIEVVDVRGKTIEDISINQDNELVIVHSDGTEILPTVRGDDAEINIIDIRYEGDDLIIETDRDAPDDIITIPAVRGEDAVESIVSISFDSESNDLLIEKEEETITVPMVRGEDAAAIDTAVINAEDELVITMDDDETTPTVYTIPGVGAAIESAAINENGQLVLTLTNEETVTTTESIVGRDGNGVGIVDADFTEGTLTLTVAGADEVESEINAGTLEIVSVTGARIDEEGAEGILVLELDGEPNEIIVGNVYGQDGRFVENVRMEENGDLILEMNVGDDINAGNTQGEPGRSVVGAEVQPNGQLIIEFSDGQFEDAGNVGEGGGVVVWDSEEAPYDENQAVIHEGGLYISQTDNNSDEPPSANWASLALADQIIEVRRPRITSPSGGDTAFTINPRLIASVYAPIVSSDTRIEREFQVDLVANDFSDPVYTFTGDVDQHQVTDDLALDTNYKWRCRDTSEREYVSDWSDPADFYVPAGVIETPTVSIHPGENQFEAFAAPQFITSAFNNEFSADEHIESDWQVRRTSDSVVVWESLSDSENLESVVVPFGELVEDTAYEIRVIHRAENIESAWSEWYSFETEDVFDYIETPTIISIDSDDVLHASQFKKSERFAAFNTIGLNFDRAIWEIREVSSGNLISSQEKTSGYQQLDTSGLGLDMNVQYRATVEYVSTRFGGEVSDGFDFEFEQFIEQPIVTTEADINAIGLEDVFNGSEFYAVNDSHISTQWEVRDFYTDVLIVESEIDEGNLTEFILETYLGDGEFKIRVRYIGEFVESPWSEFLDFSFQGDEPSVYSGSQDDTVRRMTASGLEIWSFEEHTNQVWAVAVDADGFVYSASSDSTVKKIDPQGNEVWSFTGHSSFVRTVAVDADGFVYSGSNDNTVRKIDADGNEVWSFTGHSATVIGVAVDTDGFVYSSSEDNTVRKIDPDGNEVWSFEGHTSAVDGVAVDADGFVYSGSQDNTVRKITPTGTEVWSFTGHSSFVWGITVDAGGFVYSGSQDQTVRKIDPQGNEVWSFTGHNGTVRSSTVYPGAFTISQGLSF